MRKALCLALGLLVIGSASVFAKGVAVMEGSSTAVSEWAIADGDLDTQNAAVTNMYKKNFSKFNLNKDATFTLKWDGATAVTANNLNTMYGVINVTSKRLADYSSLQGTIVSQYTNDGATTIGGNVVVLNPNGIAIDQNFSFKADSLLLSTANYADAYKALTVNGTANATVIRNNNELAINGFYAALTAAKDGSGNFVTKDTLRLSKSGNIYGWPDMKFSKNFNTVIFKSGAKGYVQLNNLVFDTRAVADGDVQLTVDGAIGAAVHSIVDNSTTTAGVNADIHSADHVRVALAQNVKSLDFASKRSWLKNLTIQKGESVNFFGAPTYDANGVRTAHAIGRFQIDNIKYNGTLDANTLIRVYDDDTLATFTAIDLSKKDLTKVHQLGAPAGQKVDYKQYKTN